MASIHEELSERFARWDARTRGVEVYPHPVEVEPPFARFPGHRFVGEDFDDGRRPTLLSSLVGGFWRKPTRPPPEEEATPDPPPAERGEVAELPLFLPPAFNVKGPEFSALLEQLSNLREPLAFELLGTPQHVTAQLAVGATDEARVRQQLRAFCPEIVCVAATGALEAAHAASGGVCGVVEFGLSGPCALPLSALSQDVCVPLVGALGDLRDGEFGLFQVIFRALEEPWADEILQSVSRSDESAVFVNAPELLGGARNKVARRLFGAVVRIAAGSAELDRTWEILRHLAPALRPFSPPGGNELMPLHNSAYPYEAHVEDMLRRRSRRAGMLLNADELSGFVRFPSSAVRSTKLRRQTARSRPAPDVATREGGILLGVNEHAGERLAVRLSPEQRVRHTHLIGASGTGKSTLLFNLIRQDIENGEGVGVFDPHGDLVERLLGVIPEKRLGDVVLLDPSDENFVVGFNLLSAHSDWEKNLLASDLVAVFRRLSTSWGDQMGSVLNNAILAFLESDRGGTLADMRRFLLDAKFRDQFLSSVRDPEVVYYWRKAFAQLSGSKSIGPVLTRLETFLAPKPIRYMVGQARNRLDFGQMLDGGKIFLAKLPQGVLGKENAHLLGSLLVAKLQQTAMSRQRLAEGARRDFWLYLDEFSDFMTPSLAEMLKDARKYRVGLTLAHQEMRQIQRDPDVASAVMGNAYTRVCFRVGDGDARALESGFANFEARDLQNLSTGQAVCRVERSEYDFNLSVCPPELPPEEEMAARRGEAVAASRARYATPRAEVEAELARSAGADEAKPGGEKERVVSAPEIAPVAAAPEPKVEPPPAKPPHVPVASPVAASADPGRGGTQHKAIQKRIKEAAEGMGFRVMVEHGILDGAGCVDLVFARDGLLHACEVTVTTTIDHEVGNVAKCLKGGFTRVLVVAVDEKKLAKLESAVSQSLGIESASAVRYFLPDDLIEFLRAVPQSAPSAPEVREIRGYKVKKKYPQLSPEEAKAREQAGIEAIAEAMRRKPAKE